MINSRLDRDVVRGLLWLVVHFLFEDVVSALVVADNAGLDDWAGVVLPTADEPPCRRGNEDCDQENDSVVHVVACDWANSWEEKDDGNKQSPDDGPDVDNLAVFTHVPWTRLEFVEHDLAHNWDAIRPIQTDSADVEYSENSLVID